MKLEKYCNDHKQCADYYDHIWKGHIDSWVRVCCKKWDYNLVYDLD